MYGTETFRFLSLVLVPSVHLNLDRERNERLVSRGIYTIREKRHLVNGREGKGFLQVKTFLNETHSRLLSKVEGTVKEMRVDDKGTSKQRLKRDGVPGRKTSSYSFTWTTP